MQLAVEQPLTGGHWNPPKKDNRMSKDEEAAARGRKGVFVIKSNPVSTGWVMHRLENNDAKEVLALL